jgi:hypothetical protein
MGWEYHKNNCLRPSGSNATAGLFSATLDMEPPFLVC